jgi:YD repeat-containing protein
MRNSPSWFVASCLLVAACGNDVGVVSSEPATRLERIGTAGTLAFDAEGFPMQIAAPAGTYSLVWDGGELRRIAIDTAGRRVEAELAFADGRVTGLTATASDGHHRHDRIEYGAAGELASWQQGDVRRVYRYDEAGRLTGIDDGRGVHTTFVYNVDGCPQYAREAGAELEYVYADNGKLAATADDRGVTGIEYNTRGMIRELAGTALVYGGGDAQGLDLWPGHYFGGAASGFPAHGELFRLDGACDPTLMSQQTVLSLVIASLL